MNEQMLEFKMSKVGYMYIGYDIRELESVFCVEALYDESLAPGAGGCDYREFKSGKDAAEFIKHVLTHGVGWTDFGNELGSPDGKTRVEVHGDKNNLNYRFGVVGFGEARGYCTIR